MGPERYSFQPDYAVPPGTTLKETLDCLGLSQVDLASRTGLAEKTISQIINGIAPITFETAEKLEMVTGVSAGFWNRRELGYREALARAEENEVLEEDLWWLKEVPITELHKRTYIQHPKDKARLLREVLCFFGVSSVSAWRKTWLAPEAQFRGTRAQETKPAFVAAWLRMGELRAREIQCEPFDAREFKRALERIRHLTTFPLPTCEKELTYTCAAAGVACFFIPEIPRASVSGATRWLTRDKAVIQLSLKYKSDDQVWFAFFHEAGHILLHGKRAGFIEYSGQPRTAEEEDADSFARAFLIPPRAAVRLPVLRSKYAIRSFARELGIAPGIVVGRLQHDKYLPHKDCNDLKRRVEWSRT